MALRSSYYGLKKKLLEKVKALPAIKSIGDGLSLNSTTGVLSASGGGGTTVIANPEGEASTDLEKLQVGESIYEIPSYTLPAATDASLGGVKIGSGITVSQDGTISTIPINVFRELAKSKVQGGTPTVPTVLSDRANNISGGFVKELVNTVNGVNNYIVYWYITFTYTLGTTAFNVYGNLFSDVPLPKTWTLKTEAGTTLFDDDNNMLEIFNDGSYGPRAQLHPIAGYSANRQFTFFGMYPTAEDV